MNLTTIPVLEVILRYEKNETEDAERAYQALVAELAESGLSCVHFVTGPASPDGTEQLMRMYISIPQGQKLLEQLPEIGELQTRLQSVFLSAARTGRQKTDILH